MTLALYVGSKANPALFFPFEGMGVDITSVRRSAITFIRARHHVPDPVVLDPHEAQRRINASATAKFLATFREDTRNLNGLRDIWWTHSGAFAVGCEEPTS